MLTFRTVNFIFGFALLGVVVLHVFFKFSSLYAVLIAISWLLLTIAGSGLIQWNYFLKSLHSNPNISENLIAITFDDGPNPEYTPQVLALLEKFNAKATFFCIGKNIEKHPTIFKEIIAKGHTVGNHTYTHDTSFGFFKTVRIVKELQDANTLIKKITRLEARMFRPAFGVTNPRIKKALQSTKHTVIGWNKRSLDTRSYSENYCYTRITKNLKKGDIILLHDTSQKSVAILERLLLFLQTNQMQSTTVDSLLKIQPYA